MASGLLFSLFANSYCGLTASIGAAMASLFFLTRGDRIKRLLFMVVSSIAEMFSSCMPTVDFDGSWVMLRSAPTWCSSSYCCGAGLWPKLESDRSFLFFTIFDASISIVIVSGRRFS